MWEDTEFVSGETWDALLRVVRVAKAYHTHAMDYTPWCKESRELHEALKALPDTVKDEL